MAASTLLSVLMFGIFIAMKCNFSFADAQLQEEPENRLDAAAIIYQIMGDFHELKYENKVMAEKIKILEENQESLETTAEQQAKKIESLEKAMQLEESSPIGQKLEMLEEKLESLNIHTKGVRCCDNGWVSFEGHCYLFVDVTVATWSQGMHHCKDNYNAYLATIETPAEDLFLRDHTKRLFKNVADRQRVWFWLGGSDEEVEGVWRWYNDHSKFNYTNWHPGEPVVGSQHCLCLWGPHDFTKWDDHYCNRNAHYICEKSMESDEKVIVG